MIKKRVWAETNVNSKKNSNSSKDMVDAIISSDAEVKREEAMMQYYRTMTEQTKANSMASALDTVAFREALDEEQQQKCKKKYRDYVMNDIFNV